MKTAEKKGLEMQATAEVSFTFKRKLGKRVYTHKFSMNEFMKDPWEYGSLIRSQWFADRKDATEYFDPTKP